LWRRVSSTSSSIFDLSAECDQLERAIRDNDVQTVKKFLQIHHGKFPVDLAASFLDKSSCDSRRHSHVSQDVEILLLKSQTLIESLGRKESVATESDVPYIFRTSLHLAVQHSAYDVLKLLLKFGVDPNEPSGHVNFGPPGSRSRRASSVNPELSEMVESTGGLPVGPVRTRSKSCSPTVPPTITFSVPAVTTTSVPNTTQTFTSSSPATSVTSSELIVTSSVPTIAPTVTTVNNIRHGGFGRVDPACSTGEVTSTFTPEVTLNEGHDSVAIKVDSSAVISECCQSVPTHQHQQQQQLPVTAPHTGDGGMHVSFDYTVSRPVHHHQPAPSLATVAGDSETSVFTTPRQVGPSSPTLSRVGGGLTRGAGELDVATTDSTAAEPHSCGASTSNHSYRISRSQGDIGIGAVTAARIPYSAGPQVIVSTDPCCEDGPQEDHSAGVAPTPGASGLRGSVSRLQLPEIVETESECCSSGSAFDIAATYSGPGGDDLLVLPPLFTAVLEGRARAVRLLLRYGACPHVTDRHGCTPLHLACTPEFLSPECVYLLLRAGAKVNVANCAGVTPYLLYPKVVEEQRNLVSTALSRIPQSAAVTKKSTGSHFVSVGSSIINPTMAAATASSPRPATPGSEHGTPHSSGTHRSGSVSRFFKRLSSESRSRGRERKITRDESAAAAMATATATASTVTSAAFSEMRERASSLSSCRSLRSRHHSSCFVDDLEISDISF
ncbi:hypothetical protein BaRGS_00000175, partial [Batillaria attramentaria]